MRAPRILGHFRIWAILAVAALLGAAGTLPAQSPPSDLQQQQTALLYVRCLSQAARAHDDKARSANAVAQEILPLCSASLVREEHAFSAGLSPDDRLVYQHAVAQAQPALALDAVIGERGGDIRDGSSVVVAGETSL
jgi:hypothetical protein